MTPNQHISDAVTLNFVQWHWKVNQLRAVSLPIHAPNLIIIHLLSLNYLSSGLRNQSIISPDPSDMHDDKKCWRSGIYHQINQYVQRNSTLPFSRYVWQQQMLKKWNLLLNKSLHAKKFRYIYIDSHNYDDIHIAKLYFTRANKYASQPTCLNFVNQSCLVNNVETWLKLCTVFTQSDAKGSI